jgi:hypothetical protein
MTGTFTARLREYEQRAGMPDKITAKVVVDQVYAHYQHEGTELHHPRGGQAFYLSLPLMENFQGYLRDYARTLETDGGQGAMRRAAEHLSDQVAVHAPVLDGDLRESGHPSVSQGERTVYDRAPIRPRLTEEELRAKSHRTLIERWNAGLDVFWTRHGRVVHVPAGKRRRPWA